VLALEVLELALPVAARPEPINLLQQFALAMSPLAVVLLLVARLMPS
jgi:hypothetical protein